MLKDTVIRMCRSFTVFTINPTVPISRIRNKWLNGRKLTERIIKSGISEVCLKD